MIKISKLVKRILIIFFSVIFVIVLVLLTAPVLFKNQLVDLAKTELNKMLLAKVDFKDLKLSFIRNFPNAYIALDGLEVTGTGDFEDELLVAFDKFSVTVDLMSVIKMDNIEVKSILLDKARLNGRILEDGQANWNIFKTAEGTLEEAGKAEGEEETAEKEGEAFDPFKFRVGLNKFEIRDMTAAFRDDKNKLSGNIEALNFNLHGDMKREKVDLDLKLTIDGIDFWMNDVRFANKVNIVFVSDVAADLKNLLFTIKDNKFNLNDIVLKLDGSIDIEDKDIIADVTFATEKTDFKSLLSLVPAVYMSDFKNLKTTGALVLNGGIKGTYNEKQMPNADVNLSVENATFSYPYLPKSVQNINIALRAHYDGEVFDRTTADLDRLSFVIAGNPFNAEVHVKTPESDLQVAAKFAGKIDIDSIEDLIPMPDTKLNGLLECDLSLAGRMSTIQNERYEDFNAAGHLKLSGFDFVSKDFPMPVKITGMHLNFTPRFVELANLDVIVGSTDIAMNGSLENFIPFVLRNDTVKGTLALRSNNINLNEFMGGEKKEEAAAEKQEAGQMSIIEVPKNVDFALTVNAGKILFDKLVITNTSGAVTVKDGKLLMRNLSMNMLDGNMTLNGEYNTQDIANTFADLSLNVNQFDISSAIETFQIVQKILPESQNYAGKVSANLTMYSPLDPHFSPVLDKINSKGRLQTQNLQIRNSKIFAAVADISRNENWRTPSLNNVNVSFEIKNGRLYVEDPIVIRVQSSRLELKGDQGLDMTMNYRLDAFMPLSTVGAGATNILSNIPGGSSISEIQLTGLVKGTVKDPDISLSMADMAGAVRDQAVAAVRTQVSAEVNRQIDNIMAEANKQADNVRSAAKTAADRVRREADSAANRLVSNAGSNPIQRNVAQVAADKLRSEGEANARKLEQEADTQARNILAAAQKRADELRRQ